MSKDPGLFTDSTGEGMAGAEDVRLGTIYNGSKACTSCGTPLNPVQSLHSATCPSCTRRQAAKLLKGRMTQ